MTKDDSKNKLIEDYDNLRIKYHVLVSKLNANTSHGFNYGLKCKLIDSNLLDFSPLNEYLENNESLIYKISELEKIIEYLSDNLERQRMHFLVNYFCSSDTSEAFPKYLIPVLKSKYPKLYVNYLCNVCSSEDEGGFYFEEDFVYENETYLDDSTFFNECGITKQLNSEVKFEQSKHI